MKYIEFSIEREIELMNKYSMTADELFLIRLILYAQEGHEEYLENYFNNNSLTKSLAETLESLQEKSIITKEYKIPKKGTIFNPLDVIFNKNFIKNYYRNSEEMGMELFSSYPASTIINGRIFSLRNVTKLYNDFSDMCFAYGKAINFDPKQHEKIMKLLEEAKENGWIKSGICDFIASRKWLDYEYNKDNDLGFIQTTEFL